VRRQRLERCRKRTKGSTGQKFHTPEPRSRCSSGPSPCVGPHERVTYQGANESRRWKGSLNDLGIPTRVRGRELKEGLDHNHARTLPMLQTSGGGYVFCQHYALSVSPSKVLMRRTVADSHAPEAATDQPNDQITSPHPARGMGPHPAIDLRHPSNRAHDGFLDFSNRRVANGADRIEGGQPPRCAHLAKCH